MCSLFFLKIQFASNHISEPEQIILVPQQRDFEGLFLLKSRSIMQIDTLNHPSKLESCGTSF